MNVSFHAAISPWDILFVWIYFLPRDNPKNILFFVLKVPCDKSNHHRDILFLRTYLLCDISPNGYLVFLWTFHSNETTTYHQCYVITVLFDPLCCLITCVVWSTVISDHLCCLITCVVWSPVISDNLCCLITCVFWLPVLCLITCVFWTPILFDHICCLITWVVWSPVLFDRLSCLITSVM